MSYRGVEIPPEIPLTPFKRGSNEEAERRKKLIPYLAKDWVEEGLSKEELPLKYSIPLSSIFNYFKREGISRSKTKVKGVLKEVEQTTKLALSIEAEKIATIAIGIGGVIARRYLPLLDMLMSGGQTLEMIAEDVMQWFETKHETKANIDKLNADIVNLRKELQAAYAMSLPNFKYWLQTRILERYAARAINARLMGVRLPVKRTLKAMQTDLLLLERDIRELFVEDVEIGSIT